MIPARILEELKMIAKYHMSDDWVSVKKQLLLSLPWQLRTKFSTRDPKTKKQSINAFEYLLIEEYKVITGIELRIKNDKNE